MLILYIIIEKKKKKENELKITDEFNFIILISTWKCKGIYGYVTHEYFVLFCLNLIKLRRNYVHSKNIYEYRIYTLKF